MVTQRNSNISRLIVTLSGVGLIGLSASVSVMAQSRVGAVDSGSQRTGSGYDLADPGAMQYPIASPGGLDLYHYSSWRHDRLEYGSVRDTRENQEMMADRKLNRGAIREDAMTVDPASITYPMASPGGLDLYHFSSYRGITIMPGSTRDALEDKIMARDKKRRAETRFIDDEAMADPGPYSYPMAAPGSLDMYHFRSYRNNALEQGSMREATERRDEQLDKLRVNGPGTAGR